ncbi:MAG: DUF6263 family protein [Flavipsychrobacter sp.]|nr:hypothetical protein [Bacteroidota bacterium]
MRGNHVYFCSAYPITVLNKTIAFLLVVSTITAVSTGCREHETGQQPQQPITLAFNLQTDSTCNYIIDNQLTLLPEVQGQTLHITQQLKLAVALQVLGKNRFGKSTRITYNRIVIGSDNGVEHKTYDSDDTTATEPLVTQIRKLVHNPYILLIRPNGVVMTNEDADSNTLFTDSSIRKMVAQCLYIYPDAAVKPGDTWSKAYSTSVGFLGIIVNTRYTLSGITGSVAHIDVDGKVTPLDSTQNMAFKGVQSGNMDIDINTGTIITSKISQQLSGTIYTDGKANPVNATAELTISKEN